MPSRMRKWLCTHAERYVERFTVTPCSEKLLTIRTTHRHASEKTSAPVVLTFRPEGCLIQNRKSYITNLSADLGGIDS